MKSYNLTDKEKKLLKENNINYEILEKGQQNKNYNKERIKVDILNANYLADNIDNTILEDILEKLYLQNCEKIKEDK